MGISNLISSAQVGSTVKSVEVGGEKVFIRHYSISEGEKINALPESERALFVLKTCVVNEDGTQALDAKSIELLKSASDRVIAPLFQEILSYNTQTHVGSDCPKP
jgi:hypothetical protein